MKKLKKLALSLILTASLSSCYVSTFVVGNGATANTEQKGKNQYFLGGLITGQQADTKAMAGGKSDYTIESKFTFVDSLLNGITFGIYSPRTVIVKQ
jgi:hypothetical protein